jgi:RimJ/RimL family protein N-acetyltransferase
VITLRPLAEGDFDAYAAAFVEDPELARLLGFEEPPVPQLRSWVDPPELLEYEWAIADAETGEFLGSITFHSADWKNRRGETRFWVVPAARGRGVLTAALAKVLDWAFAAGMERMELTALPENTIVSRIAEKFGYVFEGSLRQRNFERGRRVDILVWGLLRAETLEPGSSATNQVRGG